MLKQLGRHEEAESLYRRAIQLLRKGSGTETAALAQTLVNLGTLYESTGRPSEATELVNQAIAIYIRIYGPGSPVADCAGSHLATTTRQHLERDCFKWKPHPEEPRVAWRLDSGEVTFALWWAAALL